MSIFDRHKQAQTAPEPQPDPQHDQFIDLYRKFLKAVKWNQDQMNAGRDITPHMARFKTLEDRVDRTWAVMSEDERQRITDRLCAAGDLDAKTEYVLRLFSGQITDMTSERITDNV